MVDGLQHGQVLTCTARFYSCLGILSFAGCPRLGTPLMRKGQDWLSCGRNITLFELVLNSAILSLWMANRSMLAHCTRWRMGDPVVKPTDTIACTPVATGRGRATMILGAHDSYDWLLAFLVRFATATGWEDVGWRALCRLQKGPGAQRLLIK